MTEPAPTSVGVLQRTYPEAVSQGWPHESIRKEFSKNLILELERTENRRGWELGLENAPTGMGGAALWQRTRLRSARHQ
jgi:hypothetical protein